MQFNLWGNTELTARGKQILYPMLTLALVNFFAFILVSVYIGGDALNGTIHKGHYFLAMHGKYTEVTKDVWDYSYWHACSTITTHLLFFVSVFILKSTGDLKFK